MMSRIIFALFLAAGLSSAAEPELKRYAEKAKDIEASGTDFVAQYHPFRFPHQPVFAAPQDLTALQQTHVLGFQHRFQPRYTPTQFGSSIISQPSLFRNQQSHLQQVLIPPAQTSAIHPPSRHTQQQLLFQQHPPASTDVFRNQGQRFSQNFQATSFQRLPTQQFVSPVQVAVNQFGQQQQHRFNSVSQFAQPRPVEPATSLPPVINQQPLISQNFRQPNNIPSTIFGNDVSQGFVQSQQTSFPTKSTFNSFSQQEVFRNQDLSVKSPVFGPTVTKANDDNSANYRINIVHNNQLSQQQLIPQQPLQPVQPIQQIQSIQQVQPVHPLLQATAVINPPEIIPYQTEQPVLPQQPLLSQQTVLPQQPVLPHQSVLPQQPVQPVLPQQPLSGSDNVIFQKSEEKQEYRLNGDFFNSKIENEVSPTPRSTTLKNFITAAPTKPTRTPKPIVKEIRINLGEDGTPTKEANPQLHIKDTRQKQFHEIKNQEPSAQPPETQPQQLQPIEKKVKSQKPAKPERTQEELINEQIQKLLQSHNLEIIDKDRDTSGESQEAQITQFSKSLKGKYNIQLLSGSSILKEPKKRKQDAPVRTTTLPPLPELPEHLKKDYEVKLVNKDDFFKQFDFANSGEFPGKHNFGNNSIFLSNGQELEIVTLNKDGSMKKIPLGTKNTSKKSVTPTTTAKPPKVLFEELAKGAIPPGADFELIRQNEKGEIERVSDVSSVNKVTFVLLEEQPDGSVKVQGVKGNGNHASSENENVNSLIKKINDGSLKLPPSSPSKANSVLTNEIPRSRTTAFKPFPSSTPTTVSTRTTRYYPSTSAVSSTYNDRSTPITEPTSYPTAGFPSTTSRRPKPKVRYNFLPTLSPIETESTFASQRIKPTTSSSNFFYRTTAPPKKSKHVFNKLSAKYDDQSFVRVEPTTFRYPPEAYTRPIDVIAEESNLEASKSLTQVLKDNGLYAMAKFLDQSGLNTILNETGPYTIFIPTDKAFKALEAQLGGTDRAEDKFRENPRLLSGLLLHHVVPGSFRVDDLLDEMTGVSLAGTQLRVNTYGEKNRASRLVTINGAAISANVKDISVPQGIAHAIDRVLFPLPVGDVVQTLRGDREGRFTKFLKALEASGLTDVLTGTKTYTVFAPVDSAFSALTDAELEKLLSRRDAARTIVLRHITPGTLYSAGMQYYQVKDSMEKGQKIMIYKELGKIKANSAQVISSNIPATNGVIHAVETLL